jgi:hypothetical protein
MYKRILVGFSALALVTTLVAPMATQAKSDKHLPKLVNPLSIDGKGDRDGIGRYNSENKNKKRRVVVGTVTAISATSITVQVGKGSDDSNKNSNGNSNTNTSKVKTYTFTIDANTKIIRKFKGTATVNEIAVGNFVQIWATSLTNGTAKLIWDKSIWYVEVRGVVSNLNTTTKMFTFTVTKDKVEYTTTVKYDDATTFLMKDGTAKTAADLANGQTVKVRGAWDTVGKFIMAKRIVIYPTI